MTSSGAEVWESEYDEELTGGVGPLDRPGQPARSGSCEAGTMDGRARPPQDLGQADKFGVHSDSNRRPLKGLKPVGWSGLI